MDTEKPIKVVLEVFDGAAIVVDTHEPNGISAAKLTEMVESIKAINDKLYETAYKDGNLEMKRRLGSMMIYVIPKNSDEPIKIVFEDGKWYNPIVADDQVYLIDEHSTSEEIGKALRTLYERFMSF